MGPPNPPCTEEAILADSEAYERRADLRICVGMRRDEKSSGATCREPDQPSPGRERTLSRSARWSSPLGMPEGVLSRRAAARPWLARRLLLPQEAAANPRRLRARLFVLSRSVPPCPAGRS